MWEPPETSIDPVFVEAVGRLLGNGLGDPRGWRFGRFVVDLRASTYAEVGWMSPDGALMLRLSGIESRVEHPFEEIVSEAEIAQAIVQSGPVDPSPRILLRPGNEIATAALLLLIGRVSEAETVYVQARQCHRSAERMANELFRRLVREQKRALGDALKSHRDEDGLAIARVLNRLTQLELTVPYFAPPRLQHSIEPDYALASALENDFQNRVASRRELPDLEALKLLPADEQARTLIELLPELDIGDSPTGEIAYSRNAWLNRIVELGDIAVPYLIDSLATSSRFTRTAHQSSFSDAAVQFVRVRDAVEKVLARAWTGAFKAFNSQTRRLDTAMLLDYWQRESNLSPAMRSLETLREDGLTGQAWLDAARDLTDPESFAASRTPNGVSMLGESLREEFGEEIGRLIGQRSCELMTPSTGRLRNSVDALNGLRLANRMAMWDINSALETLQQACGNLGDEFVHGAHQGIVRSISIAICFRSQLGDATVGEDYSRFLKLCLRYPNSFYPQIFEPMQRCLNDEAIQQAGQAALSAIPDTDNPQPERGS